MCVSGECRPGYSRIATTGPPGPLLGFHLSTSFVTGIGTCLYRIDDGTIKIRGDMPCLLSRLKCVWRPVPCCVEVRT